MQGVAHASVPPIPSGTLPESSDFSQGNAVWVTAANADGVNYLLNAHVETVRIYSSNPTVTLTITNGGHCPGSGPDAGAGEGSASTKFDFYKLKPISPGTAISSASAPYNTPSLLTSRTSAQLGCGSATVTLNNDPQSFSQYEGYAQNGKYAFEISATWTNTGAYGWNSFKYQVDVGRLSYFAGSGDHFAVKADDNLAYPGGTGTFQFGFAPNCELKSGTFAATARWFDADAGQANQGYQNPVKTAIFEYSTTGARSIPNFTGSSGASYDQSTGIVNITSGNNQGGTVSFDMKPHHKYMWVWYNIHTANGIQFQLPTDSYNTLIDFNTQCDQTPSGTANASCTPTPSDPLPALNDPITMNVKLNNTSGAGGPTFDNTYQLRQVSPGGMAIDVSPNLAVGRSENIGPFNINARSTPQTVTFTYQLFDGNGNTVGSPCSTKVTWAGGIVCTATPGNPNPQTGQGTTIVVVLKNNSGNALPGTDEMRQVSPGGQAKQLGTSLASGSSRTLPAYSINARTTPQTVTFQYALFSGSLAGSPSVGNNPMCQTQVTWGPCSTSCGGLPASFTVSCSETHVYNLTSTATTSTTSSGGTYQTYQQPDNYPSTPYVWASPPPPAGSPFLPGVPTYSYTPTTTTSSTATTIPLHFHFAGSDGSSNDAYFDKSRGNPIGNPITDQPFDTFNQFGFLWPHISYTVTLEAQTTGDVGAGENGPYSYNQQLGSQTLNGNCLDAACGNPSTVDAEPGQTKSLSYGVYIYNSTNKTFSSNDGNGYNFSVGSNGGVVNVNGINASPDISPGNPTVNVSFTARIDFTGGFWVTMNFKGGAISLPSLSVPCPQGSVTPATRAFFEVRGSDISTGGGFSDANSVCATTAPGYVSPATGYSSTSGRYDYAGGVRAYANPNAGRGSQAQYGLLSLGLTIGSPNGPIGFFSGHNEVFANTGVPNAPNGGNLGGYLSPSGPTSAHCVDDFFTKTRLTDSTPAAFSGNSITGLASGQYQANGPITLTSAGCGSPSVGVGKQITLYVDGDVTINNNICYAKQWDPTNRANVPYFALIVHGNITLTSGVSQLDGLYVAQPSSSFNGIFNTCSDFCPNQLIVNGAVIAQQVSLNRAHGTLGPLDADVNNISSQPAEIFNYVPSMIIGTPNFNPLYNSLEALFSLPPVF